MNSSQPNALGRALRGFFADHLPRVRGSSPHTILSYRDTLVLFLRFVAARRKRSVSQLDLGDLDPAEVLAFLEHLETTRHNLVATRNVRLAAIHAFFRYCATVDPAWVEHCQRVLAIPFKRTGSRPIHYLEYDEMQAVLASVHRSTADGRRDYVLLATMFNTGARVQEVVTLRVRDLQLEALPQVRLYGKGRKERWCPLWPQTAELLQIWLREPGRDVSPDRPLFCNHRGGSPHAVRCAVPTSKVLHTGQSHDALVGQQTAAPTQHAPQFCGPSASLGCGDHNDQSMVGPCQCGHDKSLRHRRSGDETKSNRAGTADGFRISWTGAVAYGRLDS